MSALALFLVVVPRMGGIATHTSWSGSRFDKNVLENVCDNTFVHVCQTHRVVQIRVARSDGACRTVLGRGIVLLGEVRSGTR